MNDLVAFLNARLDEDERVAADWPDVLPPPPDGHPFWQDTNGHLIYQPRTRMLAEVEAKRNIIELHGRHHECSTYNSFGGIDTCTWVTDECSTLLLLAQPYADHPDYDPDWALAEPSGSSGN